MTTYKNISEQEKKMIEKEMDDKFEILRKLQNIIIMLKEYDLDYDNTWAKYYKNLESVILLSTESTDDNPFGLRNNEYYLNYFLIKKNYDNVSLNPTTYYTNKLYENGALEDFINIYATTYEIAKGYPKLKAHILTLVSDYKAKELKEKWGIVETEETEEKVETEETEAASLAGGKRKSKGKSKKVSKKPVVSQKKQSEYKEILGKKMKIYKMPDSRKEYVKYKGELLHISDYKNLMKQKAIIKTKTKPKATQQKAITKTKTKK